MTKSNLMRIIAISASALIIVGVAIMSWMLATSDERNVISVKLDEGKSETIEFESLALVPGDSCEYNIKLKRDGAAKYDLHFDFVEIEDMTLKNFARIKILSGGDVVYDDLLAKAFQNSDIVLPVDFKEKTNTDISVVYYLPLEVGNEAKNAEALFELQLTATNK